MPFGIGPLELIIVLLILLVIFGAKRLPEIGRSLGASAKEFKTGITEGASGEEPPPPSEGSEAPAEEKERT